MSDQDPTNSPAPASEQPNQAPVTASADAVTTTPAAETPAQDPAPTAEPVQIDAAPAEPKKTETFLGSDPKTPTAEPPKDTTPKPEGEKPAEPQVEQKKEEGSQSEEPALLPTYEKFTLPEEIQLDDVRLGEFTKELGEFERDSGVDHEKAHLFGQKLLNRYVAEVQENHDRVMKFLNDSWDKTKSDWKTAFENDPEIGGNHKDTTLNAALEFIRTHGGDETQQQEFRDLMETTGVGNHPAMIRLLAKANLAMAEGKPLPASKPMPSAQSKVQKRYGTT